MKLFVIYIGGATQTSLIELHDMRFVVADCIEDTYHILRQTWWGTPESLHLDAWGELNHVDGYDIEIKPYLKSESKSEETLYFLNLGGYDSNQFTELHHNLFIIAKNKDTAKIKAKTKIQHWEAPHTDNNLKVENIISIDDHLKQSGYELRLIKTDKPQPFSFVCQYKPISLKQAAK